MDDDLKSGIKWTVIIIVATIALTWVFAFNGLGLYSYMAPRQTQIQRDTFKSSQAYTEGMAQSLERFRQDYNRSQRADDSAGMSMTCQTVRHDFSGYDRSTLDQDLRGFLDTCEAQQ